MESLLLKAKQGDPGAQFALAECYYHGAQDYKQAVYWYSKDAEQGHASAQYNLGCCYLSQDYEQAVYWYRKSAEQGYVSAQYDLGC